MISLVLVLFNTNSFFKHYACTKAGQDWDNNYTSCIILVS